MKCPLGSSFLKSYHSLLLFPLSVPHAPFQSVTERHNKLLTQLQHTEVSAETKNNSVKTTKGHMLTGTQVQKAEVSHRQKFCRELQLICRCVQFYWEEEKSLTCGETVMSECLSFTGGVGRVNTTLSYVATEGHRPDVGPFAPL